MRSTEEADRRVVVVLPRRQGKTDAQRRQYADLVLQAFDDLEHQDRRALLDRRAEVEAAARERL